MSAPRCREDALDFRKQSILFFDIGFFLLFYFCGFQSTNVFLFLLFLKPRPSYSISFSAFQTCSLSLSRFKSFRLFLVTLFIWVFFFYFESENAGASLLNRFDSFDETLSLFDFVNGLIIKTIRMRKVY